MQSKQVFLVGTIVFVILVAVVIGLTTWLIYLINANNSCQLNPNIWCYNDWTCNTKATNQDANPCFSKTFTNQGDDNLTECLYGPQSSVANACFAGDTDDEGPCSCALTTADNCLNNCPGSTNAINQSTCSSYIPPK